MEKDEAVIQLQEKVTKQQLRYQETKARLLEPLPVHEFALAAQEANDAWLEFRKLETELKNSLVLSTMKHLYGV